MANEISKIIIASGPVIVKDNKVLLDMHGSDKFWKFCGGKVNEDISLQQAAIKRAKEELGINIKIENPTPFLFHTTKENEEGFSDVIVAHFLSSFSGQISPGEEISNWDWLDINNLPENLAPSIIPALNYFGFINQ